MNKPVWNAAKIPLIYCLLGCAWIVVTGVSFQSVVQTVPEIQKIELIKGLIYVFATTLLLYGLIYWQYSKLYLLNSELEEKERVLQNLFNNLPGLIYRGSNDENFTIDFITDACHQITGYTANEITAPGFSFTQIIHPEDRAYVKQVVQSAVDRRHAFELTYRITKKDGAMAWVWERGTGVYDQAGALLFLEGCIIDVSQEVESQQSQETLRKQFIEAQKMESVVRLTGGAAHEFNNLLTVIEGHTSLLLSGMPKEHPQRSSLEQISMAVQNASELIRQMLGFTKKQESHPQRMDLNHTLFSMESMLQRVIPKTIALNFDLLASPTPIYMDPSQVEQVLLNLVINARDAIEGQGTITIQSRIHYVGAERIPEKFQASPGEFVELCVRDSGCGIFPDMLDQIFDPFFSTKEKEKGSGLGLATINHIMMSHGGFIEVETQVNKGSAFRVFFPKFEDD